MATRKKTKEQKAELARLDKQMQEEQTTLFDKYDVFFAFNTEQFNESFDKIKASCKYQGEIRLASYGCGMFSPVENAEDFFKEHKALVAKYNKMKKAVSTFETYAKMMFNKYESYYAGEVNDLCMGAILSVYPDKTIEEINAYFNEVRYNITSL